MSLHILKVKFKGKTFYKKNIQNGRCDLYNKKGDLKYMGVREEML